MQPSRDHYRRGWRAKRNLQLQLQLNFLPAITLNLAPRPARKQAASLMAQLQDSLMRFVFSFPMNVDLLDRVNPAFFFDLRWRDLRSLARPTQSASGSEKYPERKP